MAENEIFCFSFVGLLAYVVMETQVMSPGLRCHIHSGISTKINLLKIILGGFVTAQNW